MKKKPTPYALTPATAISPIDGRYNEKTRSLSEFFSEFALMRFRLLVEVEWLIFLSVAVKVIRKMSKREKSYLRNLYGRFSEIEFLAIKKIEEKTYHDVNSVVRYLKEVVRRNSLVNLEEFVHFGLTSEDINNTAFGFMLRGGVRLILAQYFEVMYDLLNIIGEHDRTPLLALTHGQPASPTTVGWEMKVFHERLSKQTDKLSNFGLSLKFGGATGGHNALNTAWPGINWRKYSKQFIAKLNRIENSDRRLNLAFVYNPFTTQIENHDTYAELFSIIKIANTGLIGFTRDMWTYISQRVFVQKPKEGEDGSSAMPNKVNPIDFENSEGNLGIANALFEHFCEKLPISRLQRDLTDSTVIRSFGTAFAHTLLALINLDVGLNKVHVNKRQTEETLNASWPVIAEAIQTILRREGVNKAYDLLKDLTRGKAELDRHGLLDFIDNLIVENGLSKEVARELRSLSPRTYIGDRRVND